MQNPLTQIGDDVREMTDQEYAIHLENLAATNQAIESNDDK